MEIAEKEKGITPMEYIRQHKYMQPYSEMAEFIRMKPTVNYYAISLEIKRNGSDDMRRAAGKILNKERKPLTEKEYETYMFLIDYIKENGYAPSYQEIAEELSLKSTSTVYERMKQLERKGKIEIKSGQPRAIRVIGYKFVKS